MSDTIGTAFHPPADTLPRLLQNTVTVFGAKPALRHKVDKAWQDITYIELARRIETLASGLHALGVRKGDRVALLAENCPEWSITDFAILHLGAVVVPIYPTLPSSQVAFIVRNSEAKIIVVENAKQHAKVADARADLPDLQTVVIMDAAKLAEGADVQTLESVMARGVATPLGNAYAQTWQGVSPEDLASLVYTSGTTGDPKGAMLTHGNFAGNAFMSLEHFERQGEAVTDRDTFLSFLPLCHVFERTTGYYLVLAVGGTIEYSEGVRTLLDDMATAKPTIMVCVPRVYESFAERIKGAAEKEPDTKRKVFAEAIAAGQEYADNKRATGHVGPVAWAKHVAFDKLVYSTLRQKFGGAMRFFVAGGAALSPDTARFFEAFGLPIIEGYGMTEASPVMVVNPNRRVKIGTVGICLPHAEVKIAADGEILFRGPNIMRGYWKNDVATAEVIDADGYLHTGDIGVLDDEGYLKITDRKKDIIVLANGKNVAPQPIEQVLKTSPFVSEIVLIGDKQNVVTALVVPNRDKLREWAASEGIAFASDDELLALPQAVKKIKTEIDGLSKDRFADYERVKKFALINATFSVDGGELTPTLKVKRKVVLAKYAKEVAAMRGDDASE